MQKKKEAAISNAAIRLTVLSMLFYTVTYLCRKSFDSNINEMMEFYGQGKASIGLIGTFFFIAYAVGQVLHGFLCKRYPPRTFLFVTGLFVAAFSCLMGVVPPEQFGLLKFVWLLNGFACASFWSLLILTLNRCVAQEHMPTVLFVSCFPVSAGTFLSYGISALFSYLKCFKATFFIAAVTMVGMALYWFFRSEPLMNACLAEKEEKDGQLSGSGSKNRESDRPFAGWTRSFIGVFAVLSLFAIVNNLIRDGLNTWTPSILKETYQIENWLSVLMSVAVPLISVLGGMLALSLCRRIKNYVVLSGILYVTAAVILFLPLLLQGVRSWVLTLLCLILASLMMAAINNIITSIFPLTVDTSINAGLLAGLLDGFCYIGSAISSYGIGFLAEAKGEWNEVFILLISLAVACGVFAAGSVLFTKRNKRKKTRTI